MSPTRLLVADYTNRTLRLLDGVDGGVVSRVTLSDEPRGVCVLSDGKAAVTLRKVKEIQLVRVVADTLELDRPIAVEMEVAGIAEYGSNNLVVSCQNPSKVVMMTLNGQVIDEMDNQKAGKQLFQNKNFIAISNSGDIFVSDVGTRTITQMDRTLRITHTFTIPTLTTPHGIVSVSTDQLLVADRDSHCIVILNPTNGTVTPLLGQSDGIQKPRAIAWCPASEKLYVGRCESRSTLRVFTKI